MSEERGDDFLLPLHRQVQPDLKRWEAFGMRMARMMEETILYGLCREEALSRILGQVRARCEQGPE